MKKLLFVIFVLASYVSYGQSNRFIYQYEKFKHSKIFEDNAGISFGVLLGSKNGNGNYTLDIRMKRGGVGFEYYNEPEMDYNTDKTGLGLYYITPSIKGFDIQIGGGVLTEYKTKIGSTGDYVNGYTKANGTHVNGYYRNVRSTSYYESVGGSVYGVVGITKSFYISRGFDFEVKGMTHFTQFGVEPTIGLGLKIAFIQKGRWY
jgi:hypothetical protein